MGEQQVALLGPVAEDMRALLGDRWDRTLLRAGRGTRFADHVMVPLLAHAAPLYEQSGLFEELAGMAEAFSISRSDALRMFFAGLYGGSTAFVATGSATRSGGALIGRNIDWYDQQGLLRPVLIHYCPHNGDFEYVSAGWPLVGIPIAGLNEHGLALSVNFFHADEMVGLALAQVPYRLALQRARTVGEALELFHGVRNRGGTGFVLLADAAGEIALVECIPSECVRYDEPDEWIAQANHARTQAMLSHDLGRTPDSQRRRLAMEQAVRARLGRIDPLLSAEILRDRSSSPHVDGSTVANPAVLSSVVIDPATRTLWHSTEAQPLAPFGPLEPFRVGSSAPADPIPADPRFGRPELDREAQSVRALQRAADRVDAAQPAEALQILTHVPAIDPGFDPDRLTWMQALAHLRVGDVKGARSRLAAIDLGRAPFEVAAAALVGEALVREAAGDREAARALRDQARDRLDARPEVDAPEVIGALRDAAEASAASGPIADAAARLPMLDQVR